MIPVCAAKLTALDHKVIWWLLANQESKGGLATGVVPKGWRIRAMADLNIADASLWRVMRRLKKENIIAAERFARTVRINAEAFAK